jgi:N-acetylglucosamine malate deacetylase 1
MSDERIDKMIYKKILVFAAHQDDETIGCAASLKKWATAGASIRVVFMTDGNTGIDQSGKYNNNIAQTRMHEARAVSNILGISEVSTLGIACQRLSNNQSTFHKVVREIREFMPELVITHSGNDKHRDHRCTFEIVKEACWKAQENIHADLGKTWKIEDLWAFEISDLLQRVDFVVDVTDTYKYKKEAFANYSSQHEVVAGLSEHMQGLAMVRGYSIGKKYGEAFMRISPFPVSI